MQSNRDAELSEIGIITVVQIEPGSGKQIDKFPRCFLIGPRQLL